MEYPNNPTEKTNNLGSSSFAYTASYILIPQFELNLNSVSSVSTVHVYIVVWSALKGTVEEKQTAQIHDKMRNIDLSNNLNRDNIKKKIPRDLRSEELIMKGVIFSRKFVQS